jgi:hypothetical protein
MSASTHYYCLAIFLSPTTHLFYLLNIHLLPYPRVSFKLLCIHLPFRQEPNLSKQSAQIRVLKILVQPTICTGFSVFLWALNSLLIYSSPSNRISLGKHFLCARNSLLYSGIGGSRAKGAGLKPLVVPTDVGVAINNLECILISVDYCYEVEESSRH